MGEETASWKDRRARKVQKLVTTLEQALVLPDGGRRIALTGSLVGCTNLRSNKSKEIFRVIVRASCSDEMLGPNDYDKRERFWTKKTVEEAIRIMVTRNNLNPPTGPGFEWSTWFKEQSSLVHNLCQRASRNRLGSMDELETLPFQQQDPLTSKFAVITIESKHRQKLKWLSQVSFLNV